MVQSEVSLNRSEELEYEQLRSGHVVLLKGEAWEGNENGGLVHCSPSPPPRESRLLLTLDFSACLLFLYHVRSGVSLIIQMVFYAFKSSNLFSSYIVFIDNSKKVNHRENQK
jgi:hypothetical protein